MGTYACPWCGEQAELVDTVSPQALDKLQLADVSPLEAVAALNGLGLPDERECSPAAVRLLLEGATITSVQTRTIRNSHRCVVDHLVLVDGTRVYLAASSYGATVYRISRPGSYAERVLKDG